MSESVGASLFGADFSSKPISIDLGWIADNVGGEWRSLLTNLGVESQYIDEKKLLHQGNTRETCFDVLGAWSRGGASLEIIYPVTYETVSEALKKSRLKSLADKLKERLEERLAPKAPHPPKTIPHDTLRPKVEDLNDDSIDGDKDSGDKDEEFEKLLFLNKGGNLVDENAWDEVRSSVCCIVSESFGKSTGFLGIYEGSHFLWTRHHCLAKEKERSKQILKRAQAAKFWFHYRSKDVHGDITGTLVQGQNLIDGSEQPFLDENLDLLAFIVNKDVIPASVKPVEIAEQVREDWDGYVVTIYGHPAGKPLTRSIGCMAKDQRVKKGVAAHECDTLKGSSGSPVAAVTDDNVVTVFAVHGRMGGKNEDFNKASLLKPFLKDIKEDMK